MVGTGFSQFGYGTESHVTPTDSMQARRAVSMSTRVADVEHILFAVGYWLRIAKPLRGRA